MSDKKLYRKFPELEKLYQIIEQHETKVRVDVLETIKSGKYDLPIHCIEMGSSDPADPVLLFVGGVHGLERIGSQVLLAYMETILQLMDWDDFYQSRLEKTRIMFVPMLNPFGIMNFHRANANGVDIMRNAPSASDEGEDLRLHRGHRLSPKLPWYRGPLHGQLEPEVEAIMKVVRERVFPAPLSMVVDVHSGFGTVDRLWFPYARTLAPFPHLAEVYSFKKLFDRSYPNHFYQIEPVSREYTINGDVWDYLYDEYHKEYGRPGFFPWTLEMGSWIWLKKSPGQIFSPLGLFHPMKEHRLKRVLRRHITLFDFLHRALYSYPTWSNLSGEQIEEYRAKAIAHWYQRKT